MPYTVFYHGAGKVFLFMGYGSHLASLRSAFGACRCGGRRIPPANAKAVTDSGIYGSPLKRTFLEGVAEVWSTWLEAEWDALPTAAAPACLASLGDVAGASSQGHRTGRWGNQLIFGAKSAPSAIGAPVPELLVDLPRPDLASRALRRGLLELLGHPESLDRPDLTTLSGRHQGHDEIDDAIAAWTAQRSEMAAAEALQAAGIPAGPVLDEAAAASDPHLHERGFFHMLEHRSAGTHFHPGANFHLSETPPVIWRAAPVLGQDNEYVYKELLGVSDIDYDELVATGQIGDTYV